MIQQAFISGQLGKAIYTEDHRRMVLDVGDPGMPSHCTGHDVSMFFHSGAEFSMLTAPVKDLQQLLVSLERETQAHTALTLVLCSLDPDLAETRHLSLESAEELLQDAYVHSFVKRRLLARPLPNSADMKGAQSGAASAHAPVLSALFGAVEQSQPAIQAVLQAWNHATREHFATPEEAADAESSLIELGVFDELVSALGRGGPEDLNSLVVKFGLDNKIAASVPRVTHLLNAMKNSLILSLAQLPDTRPLEVETADEEISSGVRDLLSEFEEGRAGRSRKAISASEAKARVDAHIASIAKLIRAHRVNVAEEWLEELVQFQVRYGKKEHLAMSLCNLATVAITSREFDFAEVLLGHAAALGIEDPVIATIGGEILRAKGRFPEALQAYDEAVGLFPGNEVARNGRAEVLKAMGRFPEALQAYNEAARLFPNDAVARNGGAEVLKATGRFPEALLAYQATRAQFPHDEYARCGAASVLVLMNRTDEARALLSPEFPPVSQDDWIRYHILAMIYVKSGTNLDEAIRRLTHGSQHAPWQETRQSFMNALAVAWIKRENYREALQVLQRDMGVLEALEKQKRLALIGHSYAAIDDKQKAINTLTSLERVVDPNLASLRGLLFDRYSLGDQRLAPVNPAALDFKIAQHEFALAMA